MKFSTTHRPGVALVGRSHERVGASNAEEVREGKRHVRRGASELARRYVSLSDQLETVRGEIARADAAGLKSCKNLRQAILISVAPGTRCKSDTNTRLYPRSLPILGDIK